MEASDAGQPHSDAQFHADRGVENSEEPLMDRTQEVGMESLVEASEDKLHDHFLENSRE